MVQRNLWQTIFKKSEVVCSAYDRPYHFNFFKGYLPQISFLNTFSKKSGIFFFFFFSANFSLPWKISSGSFRSFFKKILYYWLRLFHCIRTWNECIRRNYVEKLKVLKNNDQIVIKGLQSQTSILEIMLKVNFSVK